MWIFFLLVLLAVVIGGGFALGRFGANHRDKYLYVGKVFLLGYVVFAGCFVFPISSPAAPLDFMKIYLLICSYGAIGLGFAGIYGAKKEKQEYLLTLALTVLGLLCRYVLEYGEASNTYNFTVLHVASYLILMPAFTALAYHYFVDYLSSKS